MRAKGEKAPRGICLCTPAGVPNAVRLLSRPGGVPLDLPAGADSVESASGLPCPAGRDAAEGEAGLVEALSAATASLDGFLARHLSRPISRWISRHLARTPVTANQVTVTGAAVGLAGAFLLSRPGYWSELV